MTDRSPSVEGPPGPERAPVAERPAWWRRPAVVLGALALVVAGPLVARVATEGRAELAAADVARAQGDLDGEIEHLGRALRWRMPGSDHDEVALERLWMLGHAQEARGPDGRDAALAAYRELRQGLLATRTWSVRGRERWDAANERIAVLMAEQERRAGTTSEAFHRALLSEVPGPDPLRANLAALAFATWVACTAGVLVRGLDPRGRLRPRPALRWGLGAVISLVAWAVLLATAHG